MGYIGSGVAWVRGLHEFGSCVDTWVEVLRGLLGLCRQKYFLEESTFFVGHDLPWGKIFWSANLQGSKLHAKVNYFLSESKSFSVGFFFRVGRVLFRV